MKTLIAMTLIATLGGCATCQNHPVYCAVGTAIVVGSVAATVAANSSDRDGGRNINRTAGPQVRR